MLRLLTAGESHGKAMVGILEGFPAQVILNEKEINDVLVLRQQGYGRGARQKIEKDHINIISGVRAGKTIGSPIAFAIDNLDHKNWQEVMAAFEDNSSQAVTQLRPGHADFAGMTKYHQDDLRNVLERSSARNTVPYVAAGAICQQLLKIFDIQISSIIVEMGGIPVKATELNKKAKARIDEARDQGYSLGGIIEVRIKGVPVGLGSYVHYDRKLSALLAAAVMGIPAFKGVEIGLGFGYAAITGAQAQDVMINERGRIKRKSNNAGGIEGGMSNGEEIIVRAVLKPIPTMTKPLPSLDFKTKKEVLAHVERADICPIEAAAVVAENMCALEITKLFLEKFGGDSLPEIKDHFYR